MLIGLQVDWIEKQSGCVKIDTSSYFFVYMIRLYSNLLLALICSGGM